jgi:hypothetical protein
VKERDYQEDLYAFERIILKWIVGNRMGSVGSIHLAQNID